MAVSHRAVPSALRITFQVISAGRLAIRLIIVLGAAEASALNQQ
ncbi:MULTISPECIES: hypothetical protein [unclassified Streptomyces]